MKTLLQFLTIIGLSLSVVTTVTAEHVNDGKKLYLITAADPTDEKQSDTFRNDAAYVEDYFCQSIETPIERLANPEYKKYMFGENKNIIVYHATEQQWKQRDDSVNFGEKKEETSKNTRVLEGLDKLVDAVQSCPAGADDTLVVYWSGHGHFKESKHYLNLAEFKKSQNEKDTLKREVLLDAMMAKNIRLVVLLTDACADIFSTKQEARGTETLPKLPPDFAMDIAVGEREKLKAWGRPDPRTFPLFEELFFYHKGVIDINAAVENQMALSLIISSASKQYRTNRRGQRVQVSGGETKETKMGCFTAALFSRDSLTSHSFTTEERSFGTNMKESEIIRAEIQEDRKKFLVYAQYGTWEKMVERTPKGEPEGQQKIDVPVGVLTVNCIARLTWESIEQRLKENVQIIFENSDENKNDQTEQTIAIWSKAEHINEGYEERQEADREWEVQRAAWVKDNYKRLKGLRGIDAERLARAYQIAATVLNILRAAGVNVPGLPMLPGSGRGNIPGQIRRFIPF
ncbi:MAG: caspase family protein [Dysgonamonadaceae bacterium]|jgi:hypothetical protein|nr:caspase family protein [Dysgonamonadaceae bacterium]